MKKQFQLLLAPLFVEFKWYRKKKSGKWFRVYEKAGFKTYDGASMYWTQYIPDNAEIIKEEAYS